MNDQIAAAYQQLQQDRQQTTLPKHAPPRRTRRSRPSRTASPPTRTR
jgi:hypothetical protein